MARENKKVSQIIARKVIFPFFVLAIFFYGYTFYKIKLETLISIQLHKEIKKYLLTLLILIIIFILQRAMTGIAEWYKNNITEKTPAILNTKVIPIFSRIAKVAIWVIALLIVLPFYGVNISALIATLGVGSLAVALAAQDTISNIISGFMIMVDSPFRVGDRIKLPSGEVVDVLDIGVRRSRFLSEEGAIVIMPNLELSKSKIVNYTYGEERKVKE